MLRTKTIDDGTVELSESVYRCLVDALKSIAAGPARRRSKTGSMCAAVTARAALRRARVLASVPNAVVDSIGVD
jgi:hypothetical protein